MNRPGNHTVNDVGKQINDSVLWKEFKEGNHLAFSTMYDIYADVLYKYGRQITKNLPLVEDSIQDVFIYLWNHRHKLSDIVNLKFYLITMFRRDLINKIKQAVKTDIDVEQEISFAEPSVNSHLDDMIDEQNEKVLQLRIRKLINSLNGRQREVLYLRFFQNMTVEQGSKLLEIDLKYTYNISSKAILQLKERLSNGFDLFNE